MRVGIRLQNRDIELLIFLGKYKVISLDNTRRAERHSIKLL